jgi:hypothetical protein
MSCSAGCGNIRTSDLRAAEQLPVLVATECLAMSSHRWALAQAARRPVPNFALLQPLCVEGLGIDSDQWSPAIVNHT